MSYQAIVREADNNLVSNQTVGMQVSILQGTANGTEVYVETHTPETNNNGLVSLEIGNGTVVSGSFAEIDWANDSYFIQSEFDISGGTNYIISGVNEILSVPYALHAKTAETVLRGGGGITYSVGDFVHGGIVFWVDETGMHGLVCAKEDQSEGIRWFAGTAGSTRAFGDGPLAGELNTAIIFAAQVAIGDDSFQYAARICNELITTEGDFTYGDWYLP